MEENEEIGVKITSDENKQNNNSKSEPNNFFPTPLHYIYIIVV